MEVDNLPIDIHSSKLLDWLISRRHTTKDWRPSVDIVRKLIAHAIQDMPEHEKIVRLLSGTEVITVNYFHCLQIVEILKETEAESKNMFGRYSSQRMKDWQEIIRLYETNGAYLAEAAQLLQQNIVYEIPFVKKQIAKSRSAVEDSEKKEIEYSKLSKETEKQFAQDCSKMGISGQKIKSELLHLAENIPSFFEKVATECKQLTPACDYYLEFRKFTLKTSDRESELLKVLRGVISRGSITFYEWRTGEKPPPQRTTTLLADEDVANEEAAVIDFGDDSNLDSEPVAEAIDFGDIEDAAIIELNTDEVEQALNTGLDAKIPTATDYLSILEHRQTQRQLLLDLMELEAFLRGRVQDLRSEHSSDYLIGASVMLLAPKSVANIGADEVERMLRSVEHIIAELTEPNRKHLLKIRQSAKYVENIAEKFVQKRAQIDKYKRLALFMHEKQGEHRAEIERFQVKLDVLVSRTRELQKQIETEISKKYKNRPVHIMGGITAVLAGTS